MSFATGVIDTGDNTSGIGGKFAAGVVDTPGKFATCVLIPVEKLDLRISLQIF
jgi:hypothetical protein